MPVAGAYIEKRKGIWDKHPMLPRWISSMMNEKLSWKVKLKCLCIDPISGHVKVQVRGEDPFWVPYIILYAGFRTQPKQKWLRTMRNNLLSKMSVTQPYAAWEYPRRLRLSVTDMHPIVLMNYWPEFRDGTIWGEHERIVYRLANTPTIGVAMLKDVRQWYKRAGKTHELETFIAKRKALIVKCGDDSEKLRQTMGLNRMHFDITVPQMCGYKFKHFNFGMGAPRDENDRNNTLAESVQKLVLQHGIVQAPFDDLCEYNAKRLMDHNNNNIMNHNNTMMMMKQPPLDRGGGGGQTPFSLMECGGCIEVPGPDRIRRPVV